MPSQLFAVSTQSSLVSSPTFWSAAAIVLALFAWNLLRVPAGLKRHGPVKAYTKSLLPGLGPFQLYSERNSFLRSVFGDPETWDRTPPTQDSVRVNSRGHIMTIINNPTKDGKTFFNDRGLNFNNGYEVMFAGIPQLPSWLQKTPPADDAGTDGFVQNLRGSLSTTRLQHNLSEMVRCSVDLFKTLPDSGDINMHATIYPLVFQISILFVGLAEHARDINAVKAMEAPFWSFADNTGFMATHFPLLPIPSTVKKWIGAVKMSTAIRTTVEKRKAEGRRENDYIQEMIDRDASIKSIEDFIMGGLFAAIINTTGVTSYLLAFLCTDAKLRDEVRAEFEATFRKAAEERGDDYDTLTLQEKLERTPLSVWEGEFPIYDKVLDETLRILMISLIFRRKLRTASKVTQTTTTIAGSEVQDREFVSFWLGAAHRNSTIYSEPLKFDPTRFERGEGKKEGEFVPWGSGRHVCLGMRFAKLEIKTVHAAFLLTFPDTTTTDGKGKPFVDGDLPLPDQESEHRRYPIKPVALSYNTNTLRA